MLKIIIIKNLYTHKHIRRFLILVNISKIKKKMLIEKLSTILMKINDKFFVLSKKINCLVKINNKSYLPPLIYYNNNNNYSIDLKYLKKNKNEFQFLINLSGFIRPYSTKSSSSNETDSTDKLTINDIPELNIEHYKDGLKSIK